MVDQNDDNKNDEQTRLDQEQVLQSQKESLEGQASVASQQSGFHGTDTEQPHQDQETIDQAMQAQKDAVEAAQLAMDQRIEGSKASADVSGTDTVDFHHEPAGTDKVEPPALDGQAAQQKIAELSSTGAVSGHMTSSSRSPDQQARDEEEEKRKLKTATAIAAATLTAEQAVQMLDEIEAIQAIQAEALAEIDTQDLEIEASVDETLSELDHLIEQASESQELAEERLQRLQGQSVINVDNIQAQLLRVNDPEAQIKYASSLEAVAKGLKEQVLDNREQKQELVDERSEAVKELNELRSAIEQKGGKISEDDAQNIQALNDKIKNIDEGIAQYKVDQKMLDDKTQFIAKVNADPTLTVVQKTNLNQALQQTSFKGNYSDATVQQSGIGPREEGSEKGYELHGALKKELASLDPNSPHTEKLYEIIKDNGFQYKPLNDDLLEGQAAIDALKAEVATDRHSTIVNNINSAVDNTADTGPLMLQNVPQNIHRSQLDAIYENNSASPEMIAEVEASLKEQNVAITEYEEGDIAHTHISKADMVASGMAVDNSTTKTGDGDAGSANNVEPADLAATGAVTPAPSQMNKTEIAAEDAMKRQTEGGEITRDQLAEIKADTGASSAEMAKVEANIESQGTKINEADGDNMQREGIVAATDGVAGGPENTAAIGTVITAAIPILGVSKFQANSIEATQTSDNKCSGLNHGSFCDSEEFTKHDNGPASYNNHGEPANDGTKNAPSDITLQQQEVANDVSGDGAGSGGGAQQDLETEAQKLVAQRDHQLQMDKLHEIDRPDMTNDPKMVS